MAEDKQKDNLKGGYKITIDGNLLPTAPSTINYSVPGRNETVYLADDTPFTIPHLPGPREIDFEFLLPPVYDNVDEKNGNGKRTAYQHQDGMVNAGKWITELDRILKEQKPIKMEIKRGYTFSNEHKCYLTEYSYREEAEKQDWWTVSVKFVEYHEQKNQELEALDEHGLILTKNARGWNR